jgi:hypothetical protein
VYGYGFQEMRGVVNYITPLFENTYSYKIFLYKREGKGVSYKEMLTGGLL